MPSPSSRLITNETRLKKTPTFRGGFLLRGYEMEPQLQLNWSDDNGHTWSDTRLIPLGKKGEYRKRVIVRRLGSGRDRIFRIRCSEPIKVVIIEGILE